MMKLFLLIFLAFAVFSPTVVSAQKRFSYPTSRNVTMRLINHNGKITVIGWNKNEVSITARSEDRNTKILPESNGETVFINVERDNQGKTDVGGINFEIRVPYNSSVDIATKMGDLIVRDINGSMVRARISLDGDITLANVITDTVMAEGSTGNIFFDGELRAGGTYRISLTKGDININIPFTSSFRLSATAPSQEQIALGSFSNAGLSFAAGGRRVVGSVNDGRASLSVINKRGSISFIRR
jgi:hypothetical protein